MKFRIGNHFEETKESFFNVEYSPLISFETNDKVNSLIKQIVCKPNINEVFFFSQYGNNFINTLPNQFFAVSNQDLELKKLSSFPIRFIESKRVFLNKKQEKQDKNLIKEISSVESFEDRLNHYSNNNKKNEYKTIFEKIASSVDDFYFETINHPVAHVFFVVYGKDSIEETKKQYFEFKKKKFPVFFNSEDLLCHVFLFYDLEKTIDKDLEDFENQIKISLNIKCTKFAIFLECSNEKQENVKIFCDNYLTFDDEICDSAEELQSNFFFNISAKNDFSIKGGLNKFIKKELFCFMDYKIKIWNEIHYMPKNSLTKKLISVTKWFFSLNNNEKRHLNNQNAKSTSNYDGINKNDLEFYHHSSSEQIIRKLADWCLMKKDFKFAFSVYDFIASAKKNDEALLYFASAQMMRLITVFLIHITDFSSTKKYTEKISTKKLKTKLLNSYFDVYDDVFGVEYDLIFYKLKNFFIIIELLLYNCILFRSTYNWDKLIEKHLFKNVSEIDDYLHKMNKKSNNLKALLYERTAISFGVFSLLYQKKFKMDTDNSIDPSILNKNDFSSQKTYINTLKKVYSSNKLLPGTTKFRKYLFYYFLSINNWLILKKYGNAKTLLDNMMMCDYNNVYKKTSFSNIPSFSFFINIIKNINIHDK